MNTGKIVEVLRLVDFINVDILVVILYYSFLKCYRRKTLGKMLVVLSLYYFLKLLWIYNNVSKILN